MNEKQTNALYDYFADNTLDGENPSDIVDEVGNLLDDLIPIITDIYNDNYELEDERHKYESIFFIDNTKTYISLNPFSADLTFEIQRASSLTDTEFKAACHYLNILPEAFKKCDSDD